MVPLSHVDTRLHGRGNTSTPAIARHNAYSGRTPAVLPERAFKACLSPDAKSPEDVAAMVGYALGDFDFYPVTTRLNAAKDDSEDFVRAVPGSGAAGAEAARGEAPRQSARFLCVVPSHHPWRRLLMRCSSHHAHFQR